MQLLDLKKDWKRIFGEYLVKFLSVIVAICFWAHVVTVLKTLELKKHVYHNLVLINSALFPFLKIQITHKSQAAGGHFKCT